MKLNLMLTLFSLMLCQVSFGQTEKGNFMIGGGLGFSTSTSNSTVETGGISEAIGKTTSTTFDLTPKIGYFFLDKFAAGVQFEITSLQTITEDQTNTAGKFLAGPYGRYYVLFSEKKAFFGEVNFGFGRTGLSEGENNVSTSLFGWGIGPGFTIFSNDYIGIEALAKYNWVRGTTTINETVNTEVVGELGLSLGLQIYFSRVVSAR